MDSLIIIGQAALLAGLVFAACLVIDDAQNRKDD